MNDFEAVYQQWRRGLDAVAGLRKLFVLGCAKSGTTWLADLLNAHPQVVVRGEGGFAWRLTPLLTQALRAFNEHQKQMDPIAQLRDVDAMLTIRTLIDSQFQRYVADAGRNVADLRVVGDKTPQHSVGMPILNQLYPDALFIHILRDPRDVATSAWFHFGKSDGRPFDQYIRYFIAQVWPTNVRSARQAGSALSGRYAEVRYEDLKRDGVDELTRLLEFLGVDASAAVVDACLQAASFQKKSGGRKAGQTNNASFYRSGTSGDWMNHIPPALAQEACAPVAALMRECGYEAETQNVPCVT